VWKSAIAISFGAAFGALLHWLPGIRLSSLFRAFHPGILAANLIGACLIGFGIAIFATFSSLAPEWCLLAIAGACRALTTFPLYSADVGPLH
jgi:CrcB protein